MPLNAYLQSHYKKINNKVISNELEIRDESFEERGVIDLKPFLDREDGGILDEGSPDSYPTSMLIIAVIIFAAIFFTKVVDLAPVFFMGKKVKEGKPRLAESDSTALVTFPELLNRYATDEEELRKRCEALGIVLNQEKNYVTSEQLVLLDNFYNDSTALVTFSELLNRYATDEEELRKRCEALGIVLNQEKNYVTSEQLVLLDKFHSHVEKNGDVDEFLQKYGPK